VQDESFIEGDGWSAESDLRTWQGSASSNIAHFDDVSDWHGWAFSASGVTRFSTLATPLEGLSVVAFFRHVQPGSIAIPHAILLRSSSPASLSVDSARQVRTGTKCVITQHRLSSAYDVRSVVAGMVLIAHALVAVTPSAFLGLSVRSGTQLALLPHSILPLKPSLVHVELPVMATDSSTVSVYSPNSGGARLVRHGKASALCLDILVPCEGGLLSIAPVYRMSNGCTVSLVSPAAVPTPLSPASETSVLTVPGQQRSLSLRIVLRIISMLITLVLRMFPILSMFGPLQALGIRAEQRTRRSRYVHANGDGITQRPEKDYPGIVLFDLAGAPERVVLLVESESRSAVEELGWYINNTRVGAESRQVVGQGDGLWKLSIETPPAARHLEVRA